MVEGKHAFCIIAHDKWEQLLALISCVDNERNDIYLHVDAKSYNSFLRAGKPEVHKSQLYIIDKPISVAWSDVSLSDAEALLYKKVYESGNKYQYVHLLSGSDLPLKSMAQIHAFFEGRKEEFVKIGFNPRFEKRLKYYHFFVKRRKESAFQDNLRRFLLLPQWFIVNRLKHCPLKYACGSSWCSITYDAMCEIVEKYDQVRKYFVKTTCSDEHYKQMILYSSDKHFVFAKEGNLRYIIFDHKAWSPRVLTMAEYPAMMASGCLFGRKYERNTEVYKKIILEINKNK